MLKLNYYISNPVNKIASPLSSQLVFEGTEETRIIFVLVRNSYDRSVLQKSSILQGENWCWSLLGLNGLISKMLTYLLCGLHVAACIEVSAKQRSSCLIQMVLLTQARCILNLMHVLILYLLRTSESLCIAVKMWNIGIDEEITPLALNWILNCFICATWAHFMAIFYNFAAHWLFVEMHFAIIEK